MIREFLGSFCALMLGVLIGFMLDIKVVMGLHSPFRSGLGQWKVKFLAKKGKVSFKLQQITVTYEPFRVRIGPHTMSR